MCRCGDIANRNVFQFFLWKLRDRKRLRFFRQLWRGRFLYQFQCGGWGKVFHGAIYKFLDERFDLRLRFWCVQNTIWARPIGKAKNGKVVRSKRFIGAIGYIQLFQFFAKSTIFSLFSGLLKQAAILLISFDGISCFLNLATVTFHRRKTSNEHPCCLKACNTKSKICISCFTRFVVDWRA